ncbi:hypothetical protein PybrP1_001414 [[Pythium] brassicae (nom. inval.)]|nr:hypothetical protein PybrP1_001414 [[Pythium] brassicae (nom. inval.)]
MVYQTVVETDHTTTLFKIAVVRNSTYDSEVARVVNMASKHAYSTIDGSCGLAANGRVQGIQREQDEEDAVGPQQEVSPCQ